MKLLKPAILLVKASIKKDLKSPLFVLISILTPQAYSVAFVAQIIINYQINPNAFHNLPIEYYFTALFVSQTIVFTSWERSPRELAKQVLTSEIDLILLKPINLFYYKYFRGYNMMVPIMITFYLCSLLIAFYLAKLPLIILFKLLLLIVLGTLIKLNLRTGLRGFVFFNRNALNTVLLEESMDGLTQNRPPEIFPTPIKIFLTFFLPYILFNNSAFDIVRSLNTSFLWIVILSWTVIAMLFNHFVWSIGLKRYESYG
ncbi:MAG: ABC transporter permease [bacterium]|nr:ABC transporter permease [bacterium]